MTPQYGSYKDVLARNSRLRADSKQPVWPLTHADIPSQTKLVKQVGRG